MVIRPVRPTAPSHLTARERARRAARGGASRSVPAPLLVPALIAILFLLLPLAGLLIRAPWGRLGAALSGADATQALTLSLWTATVSTAISMVIGVPLAWVLARSSFPGLRLLRALSADQGQTVVLITHDRELAESAPRVIELRDGRIIDDHPGRRQPAIGEVSP